MRTPAREQGQRWLDPKGLPDDIPTNVYDRESAVRALALAEEVLAAVGAWFVETAAP